MKVTESFRLFVLEQLASVNQIHARAMFGGVGLYAAEVFFGILAADTLYFKVDDSNRIRVQVCGRESIAAVRRPGNEQVQYYEVPATVIEDPERLTAWARAAIRAAKGAKS